jgi:hypothetical protein
MKQYGIFSLMTAVALPNVLLIVDLAMIHDCSVLSYNTSDIQAIGHAMDYNNYISPVQFYTSSLSFIPWHNTTSLSKGMEALNRMYYSLKDNDPLKLFLDKYCLHLLKPLEGHTTIPTDYSQPGVLINLPNTVQLASTFTVSQFKELPQTVGIYVFYLKGQDLVVQCGSTIRFLNRMMNHYREALKGNFIFKNNMIQDYYWTPVAYTPDYVALFNKDNSMSAKQENILHAFMEQEVRSLEQAYTSYAKPTNYKGIAVSTSHNNWVVGDMHANSEGKRVTWVTEDRAEHTRFSMAAAVQELGYTLTYLKKVARSQDPMLVTDKYGLVKISVDNLRITDDNQDVRYGTPLNTLVNTSELLENQYYFYDENMNQLSYGPFPTVAQANLAMGLEANYSGTYLWYNYLHTIEAIGLGINVYVVKGLSTTKISIIVKNLSTGETKEYPSITSTLKVIYPGNRGGYQVLKTMVTGKALSTPEGNSYLLTFKEPGHLAFSIKAYNSHKRTKPQDKIPGLVN